MKDINRRQFGLIVAGAASAIASSSSRAAGGSLVAATFPGNWEDAYRKVLTPIVSQAGYELTVAPALAQDQLAKVMASPKAPPYDTLLMSPGQMAVAVESDIIQKIDPARLSNWNKLDPAFQGEYGPTVTVEVNGIAYNPELVPRPAGYRDLFENPAFAGKVSWTGFGSNTAVMAYTQLAKIFGSGPADMDAVFKLFKDHPENLAKVVRLHQPSDDTLPAARNRRVHVQHRQRRQAEEPRAEGGIRASAKPVRRQRLSISI